MPARYVSGRAALLALVLRRLEELVGSRRAAALAKKLAALAEGILCFDVDHDTLVEVGGCVRPASAWEGGVLANSAAAGREGDPKGATAFEDTERALRAVGPILATVACDVFGAPQPAVECFGMLSLL